MDLRSTRWLALALLFAAGCRRDPYMDAYFEMLNAEKRVLEDRLYEMEYKYEAANEQLESLRADQPTTRPSVPPARGIQDNPGRKTEASGDEIPEVDIFLPPMESRAEPPEPVAIPASARTFSAAADSAGGAKDEDPAPLPPDLSGKLVAELHLNPRATRGENTDGEPGDDGLSVLVEPRTREGDFVPRSARISIVALDPTRQGDEARLGRWDFTEPEVRRRLVQDRLDRGFLFHLPWGERLPQGPRVDVYVRFLEGDRHLDARREVAVAQPGVVAQSWTPRPPASRAADEPQVVVAGLEERAALDASPAQESAPRVAAEARPSAARTAIPLPSGRFWKPRR